MSAKKKETQTENVTDLNKGFDPSKLGVVKKVTLPLLKQADDHDYYIVVSSPIFQGKEVVQKKGETEMSAANLMRVIDLTDGEEKEMIANTVLVSTLTEEYGDDYVNRAFKIRRSKVEGKRYKSYSVVEIENPLAK